MDSSLFPAPASDARWGEGSRELLQAFLSDIANTRLKVKILALFLNESALCLSSVSLAQRLNEPALETQDAAQKLSEDGALHYCPQFAYADLCSLSLTFLSPAMRLQLSLLRFALRHEPDWVWNHFETQAGTDSASPQEHAERAVTDQLFKTGS
jgi:hypothetical protein